MFFCALPLPCPRGLPERGVWVLLPRAVFDPFGPLRDFHFDLCPRAVPGKEAVRRGHWCFLLCSLCGRDSLGRRDRGGGALELLTRACKS